MNHWDGLCPSCGALPCDWGSDLRDIPRETVDAVVDAILRIMPNADAYEAKAFIAELYEELYSSGKLVAV